MEWRVVRPGTHKGQYRLNKRHRQHHSVGARADDVWWGGPLWSPALPHPCQPPLLILTVLALVGARSLVTMTLQFVKLCDLLSLRTNSPILNEASCRHITQ